MDSKIIPGFSNYVITRDGVVMNKEGRVYSDYSTRGYRTIRLLADEYIGDLTGGVRAKRKTQLVHRLMWRAWVGEIPEGMWINHKDGDKGNNRLENLEVVTPSQNHCHARDVLKRRYASGEDAGNAKLNDEAWEAIRVLSSLGWSQHKLSKAFLVSQPGIHYALHRQATNQIQEIVDVD